MGKIVFSLIFLCLFINPCFAFFAVYNNPSDFLNRVLPSDFRGNLSFSSNFWANGFGTLISQKGALYFNHTDDRYGIYVLGSVYNEYFSVKYSYLIPDNAFYEPAIFVPDGISYSSIIAESDLPGADLILLKFKSPVTLKDIDKACVSPIAYSFELPPRDWYMYDYGSNPFALYDGGDVFFVSPYLMLSVDEGCDFVPQLDTRVQYVEVVFYTKLKEPCDNNSIFRFTSPIGENSSGSVVCDPCPDGYFADIFKNVCVEASKFDEKNHSLHQH